MFKIEKAITEDFERVYPLLKEFSSTSFSKEDWWACFIASSGRDVS